MEQIVNEITLFINNNQEWAAFILGLLAMGESLLVVGIAIPATAVMLVVGGWLETVRWMPGLLFSGVSSVR
ncbi:hypothetical protein [Neopusillimonas aromaticivorans]|uniref:hypothetical protein n=1 Tax=Neopusillimonas aromaticivorans TaxID=2979868 RepID=UPI003D9E1816